MDKRKVLWDDITALGMNIEEPWLLLGDLFGVLKSDEKVVESGKNVQVSS